MSDRDDHPRPIDSAVTPSSHIAPFDICRVADAVARRKTGA